MKKRSLSILAAILVLINFSHAQNNSTGFKVLKQIKVPGDGGWDYTAFDSINRRLYISHATKVDVLDVDKETVAGEIPNTKGVHGIAFAYDMNKGFTSNGKDSSVTVFDLKTLAVLDHIKVTGVGPDAILYDPFSHRVFTFNGKSKDVTAIDAASGKVVGTLALAGKPEFAATDRKGKIFVNLEDKSEVLVLDPTALTIVHHWKTEPGDEPSGLSYDETNNRLFIGCGNKLMIVMNPANGKIVQKYAIGDRMDATAFNATTRMVFSSNGEGTVTIARQLSADKYVDIENIPTKKSARTLAVDTKMNRLYLPAADFGEPETKADGTKGKPKMIPGTFVILVVGKE